MKRETPFKSNALSRQALLVVAVLLLLVAPLSSCRWTDKIVDKIYDQDSENVDYDNAAKYYIPDETSPLTADDLDIDIDDVPEDELESEDIPDSIGEDDAGEVWDAVSDEAGQASNALYDENAVSSEQKATRVAQGDGGRDDDSEGDEAGGDDGDWVQVDDGGSESGGDNDASTENEPVQQVDPETGSYGYDLDDDDYQQRTYDSTYGTPEDLPDDVETIAAVGDLATMVQAIGGEGALVGSSSEYVSKESSLTVFADRGIGDVVPIWDGAGDVTSGAEVNALIALNPDACLVYPGQLTAKQERVIGQNCPDMKIITAPRPASKDSIDTGMKVVATLLKKKTDGQSLEYLSDYLGFVDSLMSDAENCHGGGVVTYNGIDYSNTDSTKMEKAANPASCDPLWSVYVSDWDDDAKVAATYQGSVLFKDVGAAYTHTGWTWSPLSYFMSVGGVINNAAAYGPLSTNMVQPVLEINETQISYKWSDFAIDVDESNGGGSFSKFRGFYVLFNARDSADTAVAAQTHPLGSEDFNTVIVKTSQVKEALEAARKEDDGLYTMHGYVTTSLTSGYGRVCSGDEGASILWTTVKGPAGYDIIVNPCGYVGSWTDGSMEAPLECLWIASQYYGYDEGDLSDRVRSFYKQFYDYELTSSQVAAILDGSYAQ